MSHRYYTCKEKKEKIVGDPSSLHRGHHSQPKNFSEIVQTSIQKDARRY
jgi:hypothetical protein